MPASRRAVLGLLATCVSGAVAGCLSDTEGTTPDRAGTPTATATGVPTDAGTPTRDGTATASPTRDRTASATPTRDRTATATRVFDRTGIDDRPAECPTDDGHLTGTTPLPVPERPTPVTRTEAVAYAEAYERYYLRYRAMFELGGQTPDGRTAVSPHEFPDVRMADLSSAALDAGDGWVLVRLAYDRVFEGESRGARTVTYDVTPDRTVRAETAGRVDPGPNPATAGFLQRC